MAIDYEVALGCVPKQTLGSAGVLARLKGRTQAEAIITLYRREGDERPTSRMGFELSRQAADGSVETFTVLVDDQLRAAAELEPLAHHCVGCPANVDGVPFGCFGGIQYPLRADAERWLLRQLPTPQDAPLVWLLLRDGLRDLNQASADVAQLRANPTFFEDQRAPRRTLGEIALSGDNLFALLFLLGDVSPARGALLLLVLGALPRDMLEPPDLLRLAPAPPELVARLGFAHAPSDDDSEGVAAFKRFLAALDRGWRLDVSVRLDV